MSDENTQVPQQQYVTAEQAQAVQQQLAQQQATIAQQQATLAQLLQASAPQQPASTEYDVAAEIFTNPANAVQHVLQHSPEFRAIQASLAEQKALMEQTNTERLRFQQEVQAQRQYEQAQARLREEASKVGVGYDDALKQLERLNKSPMEVAAEIAKAQADAAKDAEELQKFRSQSASTGGGGSGGGNAPAANENPINPKAQVNEKGSMSHIAAQMHGDLMKAHMKKLGK
jgi:hypothetical protein